MFVNEGLFKKRFTCICVYVKLKSYLRKIKLLLLLKVLLLLHACTVYVWLMYTSGKDVEKVTLDLKLVI